MNEREYIWLTGVLHPSTKLKMIERTRMRLAMHEDWNMQYYFVDYANQGHAVGTMFTCEGMACELVEVIKPATLEAVEGIPAGDLTLCKFLCRPAVPKGMKRLPRMRYFGYTKDRVQLFAT